VDCSDQKRTGSALDGRTPDLVIDHHATNEPFGALNLVDPRAVATASMLARCLPQWGFSIDIPMADNLLTGLVTDTLGFRTSNTTPEVLRQAADLLELGSNLSSLYYRAIDRRTFPGVKYWGAGLTSLEKSDGIVWATLTLADRKAADYSGNDDADLINILSCIDDAEIAIMFVEQGRDRTKVSWRGLKPQVDVAQIAVQFGGGGHIAAAGAEISGSLPEVCRRVLTATRNALQKKI
jgi:bifunctional oligoribonuclease and PAP phosphatase NrnA